MTRPRWRVLALATLAVLAIHLLLLWGLAPAWIDPDDTPAAPPVLTVRSVAMAPPPAAVAMHDPGPPATPSRQAVRTRPLAPPLPSASASSAPAPPLPTPPAPVVVAPPPSASSAAPPRVAHEASAGLALPVYATRLPQPGRWRYALQRGLASGEADLSWQPVADGSRYEMKLEGRMAGVTVLDWVSRGAIDDAGIAPERFLIRRRGRDHQAANFQRDAGKITFSGPTHEIALLPGVQDRLSWLLQLPAVIDAAPARFGPGDRVVLMVIGARGGADLWTFAIIGADHVGDTPALKLLREARQPHDTQVEIWLDPARGHLPLRAVLSQPEGGPPLELQRLPGSTGP